MHEESATWINIKFMSWDNISLFNFSILSSFSEKAKNPPLMNSTHNKHHLHQLTLKLRKYR